MVNSALSQEETAILGKLISKASRRAISGIGEMVGRDVEVTTLNMKQISICNATELLKNPEAMLIGITLEIQGDATGNMLLIYSPEVAFGLVDLLVGNPLGQTIALEEMGQSALGEMGNIAGGFFLNSLADDTGLRLLPSPPTVKVERASTILANSFKPLAGSAETIFVLQTVFKAQSHQIAGNFLVTPTTDFLNALVRKGSIVMSHRT